MPWNLQNTCFSLRLIQGYKKNSSTCFVGDWYLNSPRLLFDNPPHFSSVIDFTSSMAVPSNSFFNKQEYAKLSRADSPLSLCFLFDCGEFSFDFDSEAKFVCQLLFALRKIQNVISIQFSLLLFVYFSCFSPARYESVKSWWRFLSVK
jgi:hypothetical protein